MTEQVPLVSRNWAGVLVFIIAAGALVSSVIHELLGSNAAGSVFTVLVVLLAYIPGVIAIIPFAVDEVMITVGSTDTGGFWDLPRLVGPVLLGLSYWRVALISHPITATG